MNRIRVECSNRQAVKTEKVAKKTCLIYHHFERRTRWSNLIETAKRDGYDFVWWNIIAWVCECEKGVYAAMNGKELNALNRIAPCKLHTPCIWTGTLFFHSQLAVCTIGFNVVVCISCKCCYGKPFISCKLLPPKRYEKAAALYFSYRKLTM